MSDWMIWFAAACVLVIAEMATGTFYLLMIAIGAAAGGLVFDANGAAGVFIGAAVVLATAVATIVTGVPKRVEVVPAMAE